MSQFESGGKDENLCPFRESNPGRPTRCQLLLAELSGHATQLCIKKFRHTAQ
jgi:hypothetical protein